MPSPLSLQVIVTDKGDPALSDSATVYLKIIDINDNEPVFEPSAYSATICENIGSDLLLFRFQVSEKLLTIIIRVVFIWWREMLINLWFYIPPGSWLWSHSLWNIEFLCNRPAVWKVSSFTVCRFVHVHMHTIAYYNIYKCAMWHQCNKIMENHGCIAWLSVELILSRCVCSRINSNLTAGHFGHDGTLTCVCITATHLLRIHLVLVYTVCEYRIYHIRTYLHCTMHIVQHVSHCMANMAI